MGVVDTHEPMGAHTPSAAANDSKVKNRPSEFSNNENVRKEI